MRLRGKASPERIKEFDKSLAEWCESMQDDDDCSADDAQDYGALIAFYPID